jgi:hypothetical protein
VYLGNHAKRTPLFHHILDAAVGGMGFDTYGKPTPVRPDGSIRKVGLSPDSAISDTGHIHQSPHAYLDSQVEADRGEQYPFPDRDVFDYIRVCGFARFG